MFFPARWENSDCKGFTKKDWGSKTTQALASNTWVAGYKSKTSTRKHDAVAKVWRVLMWCSIKTCIQDYSDSSDKSDLAFREVE